MIDEQKYIEDMLKTDDWFVYEVLAQAVRDLYNGWVQLKKDGIFDEPTNDIVNYYLKRGTPATRECIMNYLDACKWFLGQANNEMGLSAEYIFTSSWTPKTYYGYLYRQFEKGVKFNLEAINYKDIKHKPKYIKEGE